MYNELIIQAICTVRMAQAKKELPKNPAIMRYGWPEWHQGLIHDTLVASCDWLGYAADLCRCLQCPVVVGVGQTLLSHRHHQLADIHPATSPKSFNNFTLQL